MGGHESCPPSGVGPLFGRVPPGVLEGVGPRTQGWTMSPQRGYVLKQYRIPAGPGGHGRGHDFCWLIVVELGNVWGPCPPSGVGGHVRWTIGLNQLGARRILQLGQGCPGHPQLRRMNSAQTSYLEQSCDICVDGVFFAA